MCVCVCVWIETKTEMEREAPDIAPIEGDPEAQDQLYVQTVFTKHKIYNTLKTRNHKELIYSIDPRNTCVCICMWLHFFSKKKITNSLRKNGSHM